MDKDVIKVTALIWFNLGSHVSLQGALSGAVGPVSPWQLPELHLRIDVLKDDPLSVGES